MLASTLILKRRAEPVVRTNAQQSGQRRQANGCSYQSPGSQALRVLQQRRTPADDWLRVSEVKRKGLSGAGNRRWWGRCSGGVLRLSSARAAVSFRHGQSEITR